MGTDRFEKNAPRRHLHHEVQHGSFVIQSGTENSFGHLTMAQPELWASHVATFMREIDNHER
jgi:homoserine O-acetyltransferase